MKVLRAGTRVRLNAEGRETFPTQANLGAELEGYERAGFARVRFDGRDAPIQLDASFLEAAPSSKPSSRHPTPGDRQRIILENRKVVRAAFDLIRYDPAEKATVKMFAQALGGIRGRITETILDGARQILAERGHQQCPSADKSNG